MSPDVVEQTDASVDLGRLDAPMTNDFNQDEQEERYQVGAQGEADTSNAENLLHCPYCGHAADRQHFFTPEQVEYANSLVLRELIGIFQQQLKQLEMRPDPHAFLSIGITVQTSALPDIATYEENRLKQRVTCPHCHANYAVYGISFVCPRCGGDTLLWHLDSAAHEIRALLELPDEILSRLDARSQEKLLANALEDVVSFWEGYLKALYRYAVRRRYDPERATELERHIGTTFQRLSGATERFAKDLDIDLLVHLTPEDVEVLTLVFNKRHVLTHNLGLADERFLMQTQTDLQHQVGQEIEITREETLRALDIVSDVLRRADEQARPVR
jgi:hypothetical protein